MSEAAEIVCRGAPRDLGLDQGRDVPAAVKGELREARRERQNGLADRVARDLQRFFPHMSERTDGLARGSRVRVRDLAGLLARELALEKVRGRRASAGLALALTGERGGAGPLVARSLDLPRQAPPPLRLRRSVPDNDYASLEVALPWLVPPVAGINQHGLVATVTSVPPSRSAVSECVAPAALLVQDCLQRFDRVPKAVEWCERRPAGGSASILLADAQGEVAAVIVDGPRRRLRVASQGVLMGFGRAMRCSAAEKACLEQAPTDPEALYGILRSHDGTPRGDEDSLCRHGEELSTGGVVILDPVGGRLFFGDTAPCRASFSELRVVHV